jgi:RsbT co-antagonist protein rsbRD N-terminal domain
MQNSEAHPESVTGRLASYLERHKDLITSSWVERVRNSLAVPTTFMTHPEIMDHIPDIFDAIIRALRQPRDDAAMEQIQETSAQHVVVRWQKAYDLYAVLRELALLRTEFIYQLRLFEETHPEFGMTQRLFASTTIHSILDHVMSDSTDMFLKLTQGKTKSKRLTKRWS